MSFLSKLFKHRPSSSRQVAKERLQLVLVHDRAGISPQLLQTLKDEIISVISKPSVLSVAKLSLSVFIGG